MIAPIIGIYNRLEQGVSEQLRGQVDIFNTHASGGAFPVSLRSIALQYSLFW